MSESDINKSWRLYKALQDKERFSKLSLEEKLEALRIFTQQRSSK